MARAALGIVRLARGDSDLALAERLFETLRNRILEGIWTFGAKLPGTRVIARDARVSRWTAVVAIDMLLAEGMVEARKRSGTYVAWRGQARAGEKAANPPAAPRPNIPFAIAVPALDLFPINVWRRLQGRRWRQMPAEALDDGEPEGWPALRQAIAEYALTVRGIQCSAEQIIVLPSVEAGGRLVAKALCRPGNLAWTEDPGSLMARAIARSANMEPIPVPLDAEGIDVDHGCLLAPKATLAIVTPSVQFPTGIRMSDKRRARLLKWADAANSWIFEVDHASEFPFGDSNGLPLASLPGAKRVIYFDTFGKLLFPALRVAFLIVPQAALSQFREAARDFDRPPGVPNQIILADFLTSGQFAKHLRRCRDAYAERRDVMLSALRDQCAEHLTLPPAQGGLHVCARLPQGTDDVALVERLREAGLIADALSPYYANPTDDRGLLFGFAAYRPDLLRTSVGKLAAVLNEGLTSRSRAAAR